MNQFLETDAPLCCVEGSRGYSNNAFEGFLEVVWAQTSHFRQLIESDSSIDVFSYVFQDCFDALFRTSQRIWMATAACDVSGTLRLRCISENPSMSAVRPARRARWATIDPGRDGDVDKLSVVTPIPSQHCCPSGFADLAHCHRDTV
jgi:hypothetical protein